MNIFKTTSGAPIDAQTKVGNTNFPAFYPEINANMSFAELNVYIRQSLKMYVLPFIGEAIYNDLATKVTANTALTTAQTATLTALCDAAAYYSQVHALTEKISMLSNAGNVTNSPEKSPATSLSSLKFKLWNTTLKADTFLDILLAQLETEVQNGTAYYDLFKNDAAYTNGKAELFRQTSDFQVYQNILNSRRTYIAILPKIAEATLRFVIPTIGEAMTAEIVTQYTANTLTAENAKLLPKIRRVIAKFTQFLACDDNRLVLEADGFKVVSNMEGMNKTATALEDRNKNIEFMKESAQDSAHYFLTDLRTFLIANADDYPTFKNSTAYPINNQKRNPVVVSTQKGGVFIRKS